MVRFLMLFAITCAVPLYAVSAGGGNRVVTGDTGNNLDWWREGQTSPYSFGRIDGDNDGKVSSGEIAEARRQYAKALKETKSSLMSAVDLDNSGKLSHYEASESSPRIKGLRERAVEIARAEFDKDGNNKIEGAERPTLENRLGGVFQRYGVALVDTNHDKNMSREEVGQAALAIKEGKGALFKYCDISNDGQLSIKEVAFAFDLFAAAAGISHF